MRYLNEISFVKVIVYGKPWWLLSSCRTIDHESGSCSIRSFDGAFVENNLGRIITNTLSDEMLTYDEMLSTTIQPCITQEHYRAAEDKYIPPVTLYEADSDAWSFMLMGLGLMVAAIGVFGYLYVTHV